MNKIVIKLSAIFALLVVFISALFLKNPYLALTCVIAGGRWETQGITSRYCRKEFSDTGKFCYTNDDCLSHKCVIGNWGQLNDGMNITLIKKPTETQTLPETLGKITDDSVLGRCSLSNQATCFTGENTIENDRSINIPAVCD